MSAFPMRRVVIAGGSIAAVTAAQALRAQDFEGEITLLSDEVHPPYSRVPLSKGALAGKETLASAALPAVGESITMRLDARIAKLWPEHRRMALADGEEVPYDGLVIATGARARRLATPRQAGEQVVRTLDDASALREQLRSANSVLVVGAGFLGMEIASTCIDLGLTVTVVDREPPLRRVLGAWLAELVVEAARERGVHFVQAPHGVELLGHPQVSGVDCGDRQLNADIIVSAVGDIPNVEWLADSGLAFDGGLVIDPRCRITPHIVAAGDVTVTRASDRTAPRSPHWTSAVLQGQAAARTLLHGETAASPTHDPYCWTEQFGLNIKISGAIPAHAVPTVLAGDLRQRTALLQWRHHNQPVAAVSVNHRIPIVKLKKLGAHAATLA